MLLYEMVSMDEECVNCIENGGFKINIVWKWNTKDWFLILTKVI